MLNNFVHEWTFPSSVRAGKAISSGNDWNTHAYYIWWPSNMADASEQDSSSSDDEEILLFLLLLRRRRRHLRAANRKTWTKPLHGAKRKEHIQILFANWIARCMLQHACILLSFPELIALHARTLGGHDHSCTKLFNMLNIWRRWHAWRNALETTPHTGVFSLRNRSRMKFC